MVKLKGDCFALEDCYRSDPRYYLVRSEELAKVRSNPGRNRALLDFDSAQKLLGRVSHSDYRTKYYDGFLGDKGPFSYAKLYVSLQFMKEHPSPVTKDTDEEEEENPEDEDGTTMIRWNRSTFSSSLCDPQPGVEHAKLQVYTDGLNQNESGSCKCGIGDGFVIHERTSRPEDLIDLLFAKNPEQLEFQDNIPASLSSYFAKKMMDCKTLQVLNVPTDWVIDEATASIFNQVLKANACLVLALTGSCTGNKDEIFARILALLEDGIRGNTSVRHLDLSQTYLGVNQLLFTSFALSHLPNVEILDLRNTKCSISSDNNDVPSIMFEPLKSAFQQSRNLRTIKLRSCGAHEEIMDRLVGAVCTLPTLEDLDIARSSCGSKGIEHIGQLLEKIDCKLATLDISCLGDVHGKTLVNSVSLSPIAAALHKNQSLTTLKLGCNDIVPCTAEGRLLGPLAEALCVNNSLKRLHLLHKRWL
ncbi:expressed unknown protein [Seminavis robusta]|uniref:Uncharacterized protein n=1 Tax=Seminavis robusta TaxID=568900 RepID=A0A9N8HUS5_9STRA|nr:expressed unknown protein [Seminavis robusta]|eukprot:Sro1422_g271290.1 n/a (473) ;mRNA; r:8575-9993